MADDFIKAILGGESVWRDHDGFLALGRARVIDAGYKFAFELTEVRT